MAPAAPTRSRTNCSPERVGSLGAADGVAAVATAGTLLAATGLATNGSGFVDGAAVGVFAVGMALGRTALAATGIAVGFWLDPVAAAGLVEFVTPGLIGALATVAVGAGGPNGAGIPSALGLVDGAWLTALALGIDVEVGVAEVAEGLRLHNRPMSPPGPASGCMVDGMALSTGATGATAVGAAVTPTGAIGAIGAGTGERPNRARMPASMPFFAGVGDFGVAGTAESRATDFGVNFAWAHDGQSSFPAGFETSPTMGLGAVEALGVAPDAAVTPLVFADVAPFARVKSPAGCTCPVGPRDVLVASARRTRVSDSTELGAKRRARVGSTGDFAGAAGVATSGFDREPGRPDAGPAITRW